MFEQIDMMSMSIYILAKLPLTESKHYSDPYLYM